MRCSILLPSLPQQSASRVVRRHPPGGIRDKESPLLTRSIQHRWTFTVCARFVGRPLEEPHLIHCFGTSPVLDMRLQCRRRQAGLTTARSMLHQVAFVSGLSPSATLIQPNESSAVIELTLVTSDKSHFLPELPDIVLSSPNLESIAHFAAESRLLRGFPETQHN